MAYDSLFALVDRTLIDELIDFFVNYKMEGANEVSGGTPCAPVPVGRWSKI